jgi:excisionase family DNA binding protein
MALLNVKQAQERLGISESTMFRLINKKEIKGFKVGRAWRFEESDITDYIKKQREEAAKPVEASNDQS